MALPNPSQPDQAPTEPEELIAEWQEPELPSLISNIKRPLYLVIGAAVLVVVLILLAIFLHNFDYVVSILVLLSAGGAIYTQSHRPTPPRTITLTSTRIQIGKHSYAVTDIAGFWLQLHDDFLVINIEPKKASALPITAIYPSDNVEECHDLLIEVLSEVEPRAETITDRISGWIKL